MIQGRIADRYVLLAPIGSGGEARVFRARDEKDGSEVAVRLALHDAKSVISGPPAFSHDGWVRFFDSGVDPQHGAYQVFELLEGRTLGQIVDEGPLACDDWRGFVDQSLAAVDALHHAGWIHGDLNADNFMLTASGWKMLELPFSRFEPPTARSAMFGCIYSIAPEQIDGVRPTARSDLYALGCLYYYAASGNWPHPGSSMQEVAIHCLTHPAEPLSHAAPGLPPAWSSWDMGLIVRKPDDRPPSVAAARQLLADAVA